jgi:hypothetical protein
MSSSNWRDGEIRELLTIMGEKVMHAIYEKDAEEPCVPSRDRTGLAV